MCTYSYSYAKYVNNGENFNFAILQFYSHKSYCPDFVGQQETVYHILVANDDDNIEKVLAQLVHRKHWKIYANYSEEFGVSDCIDYCVDKCQLYTSLYTSLYTLYTSQCYST